MAQTRPDRARILDIDLPAMQAHAGHSHVPSSRGARLRALVRRGLTLACLNFATMAAGGDFYRGFAEELEGLARPGSLDGRGVLCGR